MFVGCSTGTDENIKTIQTYLDNEFTGPTEELSNILKQSIYLPELQTYLEEHYKPLVMEGQFEEFVNSNYALLFLRSAHGYGYELRPININIHKIDDTENDAYDYEVNLEYIKEDQTNTVTVTGRININDDSKISIIRNIDYDGLLEKMKK